MMLAGQQLHNGLTLVVAQDDFIGRQVLRVEIRIDRLAQRDMIAFGHAQTMKELPDEGGTGNYRAHCTAGAGPDRSAASITASASWRALRDTTSPPATRRKFSTSAIRSALGHARAHRG